MNTTTKLLLASGMFATMIGNVACVQAQENADVHRLLYEAGNLLSQESYADAAKKAQQAADSAKDSPDLLQRAAEILYRAGASKQSVVLFDRVVVLAPEATPGNWQRGIALCSCGQWEKGAKQFKIHHDVNPDDVENSAWYFLCVAKTEGIEAARKTVIPSRGDRRQPMMSVLAMLKGEMEPQQVAQAALDNTSAGDRRATAQFYADLYIGLYYDSLGDATRAKEFLERSLTYGVDGYMADTARVYLADRFGDVEENKGSSLERSEPE